MTDATQTELLEQVKKNAALDVRVSMPASIVSFDRATKTATVKIMMKMDSDDGEIEYPPLVDCPCVFMRGGGFHVVHPYREGDSGLVLFSDRCLDGWFETGQAGIPLDYRIHSMSDAYFIGGADNLTDVSSIPDDAMFIGKDNNSAGIQINSDGSLILKGTSIISEPIITAPDIIVNGKNVDGHNHGNVQSGNSNTGNF